MLRASIASSSQRERWAAYCLSLKTKPTRMIKNAPNWVHESADDLRDWVTVAIGSYRCCVEAHDIMERPEHQILLPGDVCLGLLQML